MSTTEEKNIHDNLREDRKAVSQESMEKMYHMFVDYENSLHEKNLKRIKIGIRCIWIIPAIFLALMFMTGSSKIIFLVLWICSLFGIAVYLIWIEFLDYNLQQKMNEIHGKDDAEIESLIKVPEIVNERVMQVVDNIDDSDMLQFDFDSKLAEKKEAIAERHEELVEKISAKKKKNDHNEGGTINEEHN